MLQTTARALNLTSAAFVGTRTTTVKLTAGTWFVSSRLGTRAYSIAVR